jgi:hypothetical protein
MDATFPIPFCNHSVNVVVTKKDLIDALKNFDDDDDIVIEIDDNLKQDDELYLFYVDHISGLTTEDGSDNRNEIRLCAVNYQDIKFE